MSRSLRCLLDCKSVDPDPEPAATPVFLEATMVKSRPILLRSGWGGGG